MANHEMSLVYDGETMTAGDLQRIAAHAISFFEMRTLKPMTGYVWDYIQEEGVTLRMSCLENGPEQRIEAQELFSSHLDPNAQIEGPQYLIVALKAGTVDPDTQLQKSRFGIFRVSENEFGYRQEKPIARDDEYGQKLISLISQDPELMDGARKNALLFWKAYASGEFDQYDGQFLCYVDGELFGVDSNSDALLARLREVNPTGDVIMHYMIKNSETAV